MIILMRNADAGYGSLAPSALKHGCDMEMVAGMMVPPFEVQMGATSARIAAVSTYLLRSVTSSSRKLEIRYFLHIFCPKCRPLCALAGFVPSNKLVPDQPEGETTVEFTTTEWLAEGPCPVTHDVAVVEPDDSDILELSFEYHDDFNADTVGGPILGSMDALFEAAAGTVSWYDTTTSTRPMLPRTTLSGIHRFMFLLDTGYRKSYGMWSLIHEDVSQACSRPAMCDVVHCAGACAAGSRESKDSQGVGIRREAHRACGRLQEEVVVARSSESSNELGSDHRRLGSAP